MLMPHNVISNNGVSTGDSQHQYNTHVYKNKENEREKMNKCIHSKRNKKQAGVSILRVNSVGLWAKS